MGYLGKIIMDDLMSQAEVDALLMGLEEPDPIKYPFYFYICIDEKYEIVELTSENLLDYIDKIPVYDEQIQLVDNEGWPHAEIIPYTEDGELTLEYIRHVMGKKYNIISLGDNKENIIHNLKKFHLNHIKNQSQFKFTTEFFDKYPEYLL